MTRRLLSTRVRRIGAAGSGARGRLFLAVPLSILVAAFGVGMTASPSGSVPATAGARSGAVTQLDSFYSIKLHNTPEHLNADGVLTGIRESGQGTIRGVLNIAPPLYGGGPFVGTVSGSQVTFTVTSTVPNPCNCVSLVFTGSLSHGTMRGTYVGNTAGGSEAGRWEASRHATFNCKIQARVNHRYVTTEVTFAGASFRGLLRARSSAIGSWQKFRCVAIGTNQWALNSRANHKYVSTETTYPGTLRGLLRARASTIGASEKFTFRPVPSCSCFALEAANAQFVTVDPTNSNSTRGLLRAHGTSIGTRQEFDITSS